MGRRGVFGWRDIVGRRRGGGGGSKMKGCMGDISHFQVSV